MTSTPSPPLSMSSSSESPPVDEIDDITSDDYGDDIADLRESVYYIRAEIDKWRDEMENLRFQINLYGAATVVAVSVFMGFF
mgnify:CR=1 FL=1